MKTEDRTVAIFIQSLQGGGAERSTVNLANGLARAGVKIDLLLGNTDGVFTGDVSDKVNIVKIDKTPLWRSLFSVSPITLFFLFLLFLLPGSPKPLRVVPALTAYLTRNRPAALMSVLDYGNVASIVAAESARTGARVVIGQRNYLSEEYKRRAGWRRMLVKPTLGHFYKKANAIVAVSKAAAQDLSETLSIDDEKVFAVYNAVANDDLRRRSQEELAHAWYGESRPPVILAAGKLKPQKDFVTLLKAFRKVKDVVDCRLVILGTGPQASELKTLAEDLKIEPFVSFEGFSDNPFKYMRNSDLFVLSSAYEGLPGVLIQALACGCPVVSTDCPSGPDEILEGGEFGDLVPVGDEVALADAIIANLRRPHDRRRLAQRGAFFSEEAALSGYLDVLFERTHRPPIRADRPNWASAD